MMIAARYKWGIAKPLRLAVAALTVGLTLGSTATQAQDASFGCKVLLCAMSTNPSWSGVPYCVPVMNQLFSQLAVGGSWPVCVGASANVSSPSCVFGFCSVNIATPTGNQTFNFQLP